MPVPTAGVFTAVAAAGPRLVAVGERGRVVLSDDNGRSWRQVEAPTSVTLVNIRFANAEDGWAVGQMGVVLHTADAGAHWALQLDGVRANNLMLAAATADLAAAKSPADSDLAKANLQAAQVFVSGGPNVPFLYVLPFSPQHVLLVGGYGMAFSSHDGGVTWQAFFDQVPNPNGLHIYAMVPSMADGQLAVFFIGEQGFVVRGVKTATGIAYATLTPPFQGSFFGGLMGADNTLLIYGLQGTINRSTDQGKTWTQIVSRPGAGIDAGIILHDGTILLGDLAGNLLLSHDNGLSYVVLQQGAPITGLAEAADHAIIETTIQGITRLDGDKLAAGA